VSGWTREDTPPETRMTAGGWLRALARGLVLGLVTSGGLILLLVLRLVEAPLCGRVRPVTPHVTQAVCRASVAIMGLAYSVRGRPMAGRGAVVANHASWLDIFALNACQRIYFVSKSEVARWPFIGWLARATGTLFIERDPRQARAHQAEFEARLRAGHKLLFFPEGTSTDGQGVVAFKPTLFQAFYAHGLQHVMQIQPVSIVYHAPPGEDPRFYGWWGDMLFGPHFLSTLAARRQGRVEVILHDPVAVDAFASRKDLAAHCERTVRQGVEEALQPASNRAACGAK
jgi:1-acyl-sn-glycerol-3-phosphate acyltransferase